MCCTTLDLREATMATTEFTRAAGQELCWPWPQQEAEQKTLRMNWVVATDKNGKRQLLMHWARRRE
jgi:hypothetical protein